MSSDPVTELALVSHWIHHASNWYTISFNPTYLSSGSVTRIFFLAHANEENAGCQNGPMYVPPTNHWTFALETDAGGTVTVDVVPGEPGGRAMFVLGSVEGKEDYRTAAYVRCVECAVRQGTTVAHVLALIIANKRDAYVFSPLGEGGRFWLTVFAADLERRGILREGFTARELGPCLMRYWRFPRGTGSEERFMAQGTFVG